MSVRPFLWIAAKNLLHPFRRNISRYLQRRHLRFDQEMGVHTTGRVTLEELGLSPDRSVRYEATPISFFHSLLAKLSLDYPNTVFIDFGAGKGRTLLLASEYPFRSIIGVEISETLCRIASDNIKRYRSNHPGTPDISVVCRGIDEFDYGGCNASDHVLIYMYNPCSASVLGTALNNLTRLAGRGVSVTIVYLNPTCVEVMKGAPCLREIRRGETFDELDNSFMPYIVYQSLPHPWKEVTEELAFQFGRWTLARWRFASVSNTTSPLAPQSGLPRLPRILQPTTYQQLHDDGTMSRTLYFERNALRYVPYRGKRYFIDLSSGSFNSYIGKFSAKTRNTFKRKMRHFAEHSGGAIDLRCYLSPAEMTKFRQHAVAISRVTYQSRIGFGFPDTEEFKTSLIDEAQKGRVCGFVLMHSKQPAAFVFCRVNSDIITYTIPGYDPEFAQLSPGTVLLYATLEKLFADGRFRVFDFGGQEWDYKALFATGSIDYIRVIWFPITAKNLILVMMHHILRQAWHSAAWAKTLVHSVRGLKAHYLWRRSTGTPRTSDVTQTIGASTPGKPVSGRARPSPVRQ